MARRYTHDSSFHFDYTQGALRALHGVDQEVRNLKQLPNARQGISSTDREKSLAKHKNVMLEIDQNLPSN